MTHLVRRLRHLVSLRALVACLHGVTRDKRNFTV